MEREHYLKQDLYTQYLNHFFIGYFLPMLGMIQVANALREFKKRIDENKEDNDG